MDIDIVPASQVSRPAFLEALNAAYQGYYVPLFLTPTGFQDLVTDESIDLDYSVAALCDGQVVGMALLGLRPPCAWIGGVGVIPVYRRQGIARRMMLTLIQHARNLGLASVQLEVITHNHGAFHLYQSLGFHVVRRLLLLATQAPPVLPAPDPLLIVRPQPAAQLLPCITQLDPIPRPWQRQAESIRHYVDGLDGLAASHNDHLTGILLYTGLLDRVTIIDMAATDSQTARALLSVAAHRYPKACFSYYNVPEHNPLLPFLESIGFKTTLDQYEMILRLS